MASIPRCGILDQRGYACHFNTFCQISFGKGCDNPLSNSNRSTYSRPGAGGRCRLLGLNLCSAPQPVGGRCCGSSRTRSRAPGPQRHQLPPLLLLQGPKPWVKLRVRTCSSSAAHPRRRGHGFGGKGRPPRALTGGSLLVGSSSAPWVPARVS